jgi:fatty-acyl-CoA synthase
LTDDERLVLTGRAKDLIVRSGHNINPTNTFPGVQISAAVGMPDAYAGEVPILYAVAALGARLDAYLLQRYLEEHVAEPPAKPKRVILLDALPVTAVGKIVKNDLRDRAVVEKVRIEVERIFGTTIAPVVAVAKDERLNTVVRVEVPTGDAGAIQKLKEGAVAAVLRRYCAIRLGALHLCNNPALAHFGHVQ